MRYFASQYGGLCQSSSGSIKRGLETIFCGDDYAAKLQSSHQSNETPPRAGTPPYGSLQRRELGRRASPRASRFESPPLHQEVRANRPGFPGDKTLAISEPKLYALLTNSIAPGNGNSDTSDWRHVGAEGIRTPYLRRARLRARGTMLPWGPQRSFAIEGSPPHPVLDRRCFTCPARGYRLECLAGLGENRCVARCGLVAADDHTLLNRATFIHIMPAL
jgi:hypothetical protein